MKIIIIGGGAAGFFAAITCAEANPEASILLLERGKEVLGKVKISGGGRCNVTHACWTPRELVKNYPRGARELMGPFNRFACGDMVEWLEKRTVATKIENDGRMFPVTDSSQTIIDCLWKGVDQSGVKVRTQTRVDQLIAPTEENGRWKIIANGETLKADKIMIATGSNPRMWKLLKDLGHQIVEPVPSLFTFNIKDERIKDLPGISMPKASVKVLGTKLKSSGPLLITHWGMSGPAILKLSAWGARELNERNYKFSIHVNWLGVYNDNEIREELTDFKTTLLKKTIAKNPQFDIPKRLWESLAQAAGINDDLRCGDISKKAINKLAVELTQGEYSVSGKSTFKEEFVTAGGVELKEVNFKNFSSKIHPNLYFAGEVLNIDAVTGGFNFQAAWTGGFIAGRAMALPI